ncbi:hypothetical protein D5S17_29335 [Pseudonocardiaceae bacterium YIM PH 21723]|nr:hypothetical protein D5S17_29335 [Pseudonocardiaceae bacterium YIM PH 21723]
MIARSAYARYKAVTDRATAAIENLKTYEQEAAAGLTEAVAAAKAEVDAAQQAEAEMRDGVDQRWTSVVEALWGERWMSPGTFPQPDLTASPDRPVAEYARHVQRTFVDMHESLHKPKWGRRS